MERIQAAIEKARAQRERDVLVMAEPVAPPPAEAAAAPVPAAPAAPAPIPTEPLAETAAPLAEVVPEKLTAQARAAAWAKLTPMMPDLGMLEAHRIVTLQGGAQAVQFDQIRTKALQVMRANKWTRLAITSPSPACGKSTIALNLAFSLSRQADLRSMLLEMDLRRPSLAGLLGQKIDKGIVPWLEERIAFEEQAVCYNNNLAFSFCHLPLRQAAELLQSPQTAQQLSRMEAQYAPDITIFDMPPMQVSDDMMAFAGQVDCVLIVAAAEETTVKQIDACERDLAAQTNVMGVVLNKCQFMAPETGYGYYYK